MVLVKIPVHQAHLNLHQVKDPVLQIVHLQVLLEVHIQVPVVQVQEHTVPVLIHHQHPPVPQADTPVMLIQLMME